MPYRKRCKRIFKNGERCSENVSEQKYHSKDYCKFHQNCKFYKPKYNQILGLGSILDISYINISSIKNYFQEYSLKEDNNLKGIKMVKCNLKSIDLNFLSLYHNLKMLDISCNRLESLEGLSSDTLEVLYCKDNLLKDFKKVKFPNLKELYCSSNKIENPNIIKVFEKLNALHILYNPIPIELKNLLFMKNQYEILKIVKIINRAKEISDYCKVVYFLRRYILNKND
jgi:hypothetical protein